MANKAPQPIVFDRFRAGEFTNRSPIAVPQSQPGTIYAFAHPDALIGGSNMEITPRDTLARRPGWPEFCSSAFGSSEWPLAFWGGFLSGTLLNLVDSQTNLYSFTGSAKTSIFTKTTTAQTFFQKVGNILYFSDGAENMQWDGINTPTNNGVAAPTVAPTIANLNLYDTVGGAQTLHAWVPSYQYVNATSVAQNFFFLAPTGEIQWAVVPKGATLSSQTTVPNWSALFGEFGGVTLDGTMTWTNCGPIGTWAASTLFTNGTYVTTTQMSSINITVPTLATSGSTSINWQSTATSEGFAPVTGTTGNSNTLKATGFGITIPANATVQGITLTVRRATNRANAVQDVTVKLLKAGSAVGNNKALAGSWPQTMYNQYIIPLNNGVQAVYGSNTDTWGTTWSPSDIANANFGFEFIANVSSTSTTTAALTFSAIPIQITVYYVIAAADLASAVYAKIIQDSNGNLQAVKTAGTSSSSAPSWATTIGGTTTDGGITWQCLGTASQLPALFSWTYGYSYHTLSPHTSTLSPLLTVYGPMIGPNVPITGTGSADTQIDHNDLYRTADGGSLLLFTGLTAPNVNASTTFTLFDNVLDTNLAVTQVGPIAHVNDPPPAGMTVMARYQGREWGAVGSLLYFSAGPDCTNGNGDQAWPPANVFVMPSPISGMKPTSQGLVVGLQDDVWVIVGGPQTLSFYPRQVLQNFGVLSPNCMISDGDTIYIYTANAQLWQLEIGSKTEIGFPVADQLLANFPPATSYLSIHRNGPDEGLFISNGTTLVKRYSLTKQNWSPTATVTSGIGAIGSIQTSTGVHTLLGGRVTGSDFIVGRSTTNFVDGASSTYSGYSTIGSILLSQMGTQSLTSIQSFGVASSAVGTAPSLSVLPNEISGSFTSIPKATQDPYQLPATSTLIMNRFDWLGVQSLLPNGMRHLQVKLTLASENQASEVLALTLIPTSPSA